MIKYRYFFRELMPRARCIVRRMLARRGRRGHRPPPTQIWAIGIYAGSSPYILDNAPGIANPVLTHNDVSDVPALFVADPFMMRMGRFWYMFMEVMNARTGKGEIGLALSEDTVRWSYQGIVLDEPFHLSYPYVFEYQGEQYMIPESYEARRVTLYRAKRFPSKWVWLETLLEGECLVDSSVIRVNGRWWMFVQSSPRPRHDTLRLYSASRLTGPWEEHPASPIVEGAPHAARPAGRVILHEGRVMRFAQDCRTAYGLAVRAFEVITLTPDAYEERLIGPGPILAGSGAGWNADGMHHVDPHQLAEGHWIACVDGWVGVAP